MSLRVTGVGNWTTSPPSTGTAHFSMPHPPFMIRRMSLGLTTVHRAWISAIRRLGELPAGCPPSATCGQHPFTHFRVSPLTTCRVGQL